MDQPINKERGAEAYATDSNATRKMNYAHHQ